MYNFNTQSHFCSSDFFLSFFLSICFAYHHFVIFVCLSLPLCLSRHFSFSVHQIWNVIVALFHPFFAIHVILFMIKKLGKIFLLHPSVCSELHVSQYLWQEIEWNFSESFWRNLRPQILECCLKYKKSCVFLFSL